MKKRILASLLALCLMGGMLPTAALASEPDITMPTTERKLEKNNGAPANRAPSAPASAGAEGNFSEPLLVRAGEEDTPTSGTCGENLTWELDLETGTLTISGTGDMKDYEQVYNGDADYSFSSSSPWSNCDDIKSVIIESGVTSIGKCAFVGCKNLSGILIPNSINDIGDLAFRNCNGLTSISIPDSVSVINPDTFAYCSNLTSISIPNSITGIGWGAFRGCKSLENIIIPQSVVLYIGESAFGDCSSLTSVIIPQGITRIGDKTFSGCYNLTNIMLPKSIDEIDWYAFENCDSLTDIYYAGSEYEWSNIEIDSFRNDALLNATIHYNSTGPDSGDTGTTIPDGRTTAVKYLTSWDETSKTAVFSDDSYIRYTAAADAELPSDGITQLVNRYVLVECAQDESDVNKGQLFRLQPVNSALGSLTAGTETTVTIDGVTYEWPDGIGISGPGAPYEVLYHTIDGRLVGYTVLAEKKGTAGDWNGSDTVHLDGVDFHTNYMTDQDSLAEISKIADKDQAVVYYFVGDALLKAKLGNNDPVDPPIELYYTKIGTLTAFDLNQMTLAIDGKSFPVQDDRDIKDNLKDAVGKQTVFVITSGKVSYAMPLERVSTRLEAVATVEPSTITYQGGYDLTSVTAKVEVQNVYDVDSWVDKKMLETAILQNVPEWNGNITLDHADFEIAWGPSEQSSESVEKFLVFSNDAYEDHFLVNDCKTTIDNTTTLALNESVTMSANIAVNPNYSFDNSEYADAFPEGKTEKNVQVSVEAQGKRWDGKKLQDTSVCSITARYPDNIISEEDVLDIAAKAGAELEKINGALSLDLNTMYEVFGLRGEALDQLEKEILSVIVMSNIPEETLEEKISNDIVDKVIGKYIPDEFSASTYTVPLVYQIATPKYGLITVQFNCEVHTYNLHGKNFALWATVDYEILRSEKPVRADQISGFLGQGTRTDVGAFSSAAYSLVEAELKEQYNEVWGNSANQVADFLFNDIVKMIFEEMETTFKDEVWKLLVWPTTNAKIACPVDVFVYNQNGDLCGSIENDVVTQSSNEFGLSVKGETKYITDLEDLYTIKYVATDNGTMDITLTEFSGCETPARQIAFYNVPLVKEQSYTQNIPEAIQSETEEYSLITSGNKEVSADIDQSLINLRPIVPSPPETYTIIFNGNGGTASQTSMETGTDGTLDTLPTASRDGNYRFDGWFTEPTGGVQITTSTVFTKETTVYAHWVYIDRPTDDDHLSGSDSSSDPSYRIDVDVITRGGNVSVRPTSASVGTRVAITVDSDSGYELDRIVVLNEGGTELALTQRNENTYTFIMPDGRVSIDAHFVRVEMPSTSNVFYDVAQGAWYYDAVQYVTQRGLMTGVSDRQFAPNAILSRAQAVQILYALAGGPTVSASNDFVDVNRGDWYADAVSWATANGVVSGMGKEMFGPNAPLTREQLALILYHYAQVAGYAPHQGGMAIQEFSDSASISGWALEAVQWAVNAGLISGTGDGMLDPDGAATRAQVAQIFMNFCQDNAIE
ncbi:leucine-rich repeat protein [Clostridium sp.]|uniref:leucine-rich repeat protein n=1 Tax=Clostridium sp. TaxID=1506 RepID=UPI00307B9778